MIKCKIVGSHSIGESRFLIACASKLPYPGDIITIGDDICFTVSSEKSDDIMIQSFWKIILKGTVKYAQFYKP